jgi:crossover junction endodeoxyribonuclease RuvC
MYIRYGTIMKILGIDPGVATVGLGLIDATNVQQPIALDWLTIETNSGLTLTERLQEIATDLAVYLLEHTPDMIVIEQLFMSTNQKTVIDVAQARGVIMLQCANTSAIIREATPLQLKSSITGDGKADKKQVQAMVMRILQLSEPPTPDDAADGLALAIYGSLLPTYLNRV